MYAYNVLERIHTNTFIQYYHSKISQLTAYIQNMYIYIVNKIIVTSFPYNTSPCTWNPHWLQRGRAARRFPIALVMLLRSLKYRHFPVDKCKEETRSDPNRKMYMREIEKVSIQYNTRQGAIKIIKIIAVSRTMMFQRDTNYGI